MNQIQTFDFNDHALTAHSYEDRVVNVFTMFDGGAK